MSVLTPECPTVSDSILALEDAPTISVPRKYTGFKRPIAPDYDQARDNELLNYYFDANWTTKDIAEHFKLSMAVVAAWFQRADIVAIIDFIAAANERRARDITRENLPGTIDILHRISRVRNSDSAARQASCTLVRFARGYSLSKSASQRVSKAKPAPGQDAGKQTHPDGFGDHSAISRARRASETPTCGLRDERNTYTSRQSAISRPNNSTRDDPHDGPDQIELHERVPAAPPQPISTYPPAPRTAADLIARAGTTFSPHHAPASQPGGLIKMSRG
jgi:hypothetical protein